MRFNLHYSSLALCLLFNSTTGSPMSAGAYVALLKGLSLCPCPGYGGTCIIIKGEDGNSAKCISMENPKDRYYYCKAPFDANDRQCNSCGQAQGAKSDAIMCDGKGYVCHMENSLGWNLGMGFIPDKPSDNKAPSCPCKSALTCNG